jgi:hypothetical protein
VRPAENGVDGTCSFGASNCNKTNTEASITSGERHNFSLQEHLETEPKNVFFQLTRSSGFSIWQEKTRDGIIKNVVLEIPAEIMNHITIA